MLHRPTNKSVYMLVDLEPGTIVPGCLANSFIPTIGFVFGRSGAGNDFTRKYQVEDVVRAELYSDPVPWFDTNTFSSRLLFLSMMMFPGTHDASKES